MNKQYNSPEVEVIEAQINAFLVNGTSLVDEKGWVQDGITDDVLDNEY